jgi:chromosome segregation ATPase
MYKMDMKEFYDAINDIKKEIKENISEKLEIHFKFIGERLNTIITSSDSNEDRISKAEIRIRELEFKMETIETAQKQSDSKIAKLQEFFENLKKEIQADMKAIKNLVTPKKLSWPKIISIILSILASPAVLLLVQAMMKAKGWL